MGNLSFIMNKIYNSENSKVKVMRKSNIYKGSVLHRNEIIEKEDDLMINLSNDTLTLFMLNLQR